MRRRSSVRGSRPNRSSKTSESGTGRLGVARHIQQLLPAREQAAFQKAIRGLDRKFVEEKCQLAIDTALEIRRVGSVKRTALLQRNLWSTADALAMHLDAAGFTRPFREVATRVLKRIEFTDPAIGDVEYHLINEQLARRGARLDRREFDAVMQLAEHYRTGRHGVQGIARKDFSFAAAARNACHRPLDVLAVHRVGQLAVVKVPIAVIMGAANIITFLIGWWPVTIVTVGVLLIIWAAGC